MAKKAKAAVKKAPVKKAAPETPAKKRVTFTLAADAGSEVYVAGDFNGWDPAGKKLTDKKGNGVYSAVVTLAPGEYEYKFIVNGFWTMDPDPTREWRANGLGTLNSVIVVQ